MQEVMGVQELLESGSIVKMSANYDKAFSLVISAEGGYNNNPNDPGGETNFGISKRQYPDVDIKNLTLAGAKGIYQRDYWNVIKGDQLPWPLCAFVFDCAVNQGCDSTADFAAQKMLQNAFGLTQDGILGPATLSATGRSGKFQEAKFMSLRALRYTKTNNFSTFGEGWLIRLFELSMEV